MSEMLPWVLNFLLAAFPTGLILQLMFSSNTSHSWMDPSRFRLWLAATKFFFLMIIGASPVLLRSDFCQVISAAIFRRIPESNWNCPCTSARAVEIFFRLSNFWQANHLQFASGRTFAYIIKKSRSFSAVANQKSRNNHVNMWKQKVWPKTRNSKALQFKFSILFTFLGFLGRIWTKSKGMKLKGNLICVLFSSSLRKNLSNCRDTT